MSVVINPATKLVIPAAAERRAGIQNRPCKYWIPAFAGMTRGSIEAINTSERIPLRLNASPRKRSLSPPKQISTQSIRLTPAPIAASTLCNASSLSVGRRSSRPPAQPLKLSIPIFQVAYIPFPNFPSYLIVIQCGHQISAGRRSLFQRFHLDPRKNPVHLVDPVITPTSTRG